MIDPDVVFGKDVKIYNSEQVNIYGCSIGDRSFVGPFVEITRGVVIGTDCRIMSHSFLCTEVTLENNVFIGHGVMFTNDLYPRTDRHVEYLPTMVGQHASIGTNATVIAGVTIGAHAVVGAGAVVSKDVPAYSIVAGNPARVRKQFSSESELMSYVRNRQPSARSQQG